ncbi:MAG: methyltransferase domain-containing protein [Atopobiaceae bacterium]|nr:methyltransferase domain-containing protein [Atopobiaceae bacterium]
MLDWACGQIVPRRIIDCGCGSGRFALAAARHFPDAHVVAIDVSPVATTMCKANAVASGASITVIRGDFTQAELPFDDEGPTLWIGNPPYVRHHELAKERKSYHLNDLRTLGVRGNALAGLHSHFVASIARRFRDGDVGCLIMSAEWMDVGYGAAIRDILTKRLPMTRLRLFDKSSEPFSGTMTSAVVVGFGKGSLDGFVSNGDATIALGEFQKSDRWSDVLSRTNGRTTGKGYVRLGDIARVHRGVVTGKNSFWVRRPGEVSEQLSVPVVAHARELAGADPACRDVASLSRLVTLPDDISSLPAELHAEANAIIRDGLHDGVDRGFVASHRRHWWSIKAPKAPAIMMTYMARHAPTFVVNVDGLGMLNVVHGIYPTVHLSDGAIRNLAEYLNKNVAVSDGRVYAGGLAKFEPREVERLVVPSPEVLEG